MCDTVTRRARPGWTICLPSVHAARTDFPGPCVRRPTARLHQLKLIAAARVSAARSTSRQQVADIVRVTVDNEVDTSTFRAIVADVAPDTLR